MEFWSVKNDAPIGLCFYEVVLLPKLIARRQHLGVELLEERLIRHQLFERWHIDHARFSMTVKSRTRSFVRWREIDKGREISARSIAMHESFVSCRIGDTKEHVVGEHRADPLPQSANEKRVIAPKIHAGVCIEPDIAFIRTP